MENCFRLLAGASDLLARVFADIASVGTTVIPSGGTGGKIRYTPPYCVEECICLHASKIDSRRFVVMATGDAIVVRDNSE